jgi:hypothetical protein
VDEDYQFLGDLEQLRVRWLVAQPHLPARLYEPLERIAAASAVGHCFAQLDAVV